MKKVVFGMTLLAALAVWVMPAAAGHHEGDPDKKINVSGEVRSRWEYTENIFDASDDDVAGVIGVFDDSGDFFPYRARIAAEGMFSDDVWGVVEMQAFGNFGNEDPLAAVQHPLGQQLLSSPNGDTELYQGFLHLNSIGGSNWDLRIGRQEYTLGNELHFGDADFYNGISLDGLRATRDTDSWDLDLFYFIQDEAILDNQDELWGAVFNFGIVDDEQFIEPYLIFNRDTGSGPDRDRIWTIGALYGSADDYDNPWDWSFEAAFQGGDTDQGPSELDVSASIIEGELGYTLDEKHRFHLGLLMASGDDDPLDDDAEAFRPILPDVHANNRLGDIDLFGGPSVANPGIGMASNMTNVTDINLGYGWVSDDENNMFRVSIHNLTLTEEDASGEDEIGNEIDLVYDYMYSKNVGFQIGYAQLLAGDLLDANFNGASDADDVMRAWWQLRLRWK